MKLFPDFEELLAAFDAEAVSFLVVGGYAVGFHGSPRSTKDLDLWVSGSGDNLEKLARALARFGAPAEIVRHAAALQADEILYFGQPPVRIDILRNVDGLEFDGALGRAVDANWAGHRVRVLGLDDLLTNKRAAGREQDLLDVRALEKLGSKKA